MLSEQQAEKIKTQLLSQLENTNLPNQESIKENIETMNPQELEEFLNQNNLVNKNSTQCIFCSIAFGEVQSYKIAENEKAVAVLEINPVSKGHILIIPKEHILSEKEIPKQAKELAKKIAKKIKSLKPKSIEIVPSNMFGHEILNVFPVYKNETLDSKRNRTEPEELLKLQKEFEEKPKLKLMKKPKTKKIEEKIWLPKRIP